MTGVSSEIGLGIIEIVTAKVIEVFGSVRKNEDADGLQSALIFDATDVAAVESSEFLRKWLIEAVPTL